jgi:hypothetical protein
MMSTLKVSQPRILPHGKMLKLESCFDNRESMIEKVEPPLLVLSRLQLSSTTFHDADLTSSVRRT